MYDKDLSKLITDARELLGQLKNQYEINAAQIKQNTEMINVQRDILEKRIALVERSWSVFRNIFVTVFTFVMLPILIGGFTMKSDIGHIKDEMKSTECVEAREVLMSLGFIIDEQTDALESVGMEQEEADRVNEKMKQGVSRAFGYEVRNINE